MWRSKYLGLFLMTLALIASTHIPAAAAPGDLDPTFGTGGKLLFSCGAKSVAKKVKTLPDYSMFILAETSNASGRQRKVCIIKLTSRGALDTSFGRGTGMAIHILHTPSTESYEETVPVDFTVLPSGAIVIMATRISLITSEANGLIGLKRNGDLDEAFGFPLASSPGKRFINNAWRASIESDSAGNIYVGCNHYGGKVMKLKADGRNHPDSDWDGYIWYSAFLLSGGYQFYVNAIKIQPDNKIVLAGYYTNPTSTLDTKSIVRLNPVYNSPDTSFGFGGITAVSETTSSFFNSIAVRSDGGLVALSPGGTLHRFNSVGSPIGRTAVWSSATFGEWGTIDLQSDNSVLQAEALWGNFFGVMRYRPDLSADPTWGGGTFRSTYFGGSVRVTHADVDAKDRFVVVGERSSPSPGQIAVARYSPW